MGKKVEKFTSGPWHIEKPDGYNQLTWNILHAEGWVAELYNKGDNETEANANIIAAAPDMYEALKEIIEQTESFHRQEQIYANEYNNNTPGVGQGSHQYAVASPLPKWVDKAKAAIKRATNPHPGTGGN